MVMEVQTQIQNQEEVESQEGLKLKLAVTAFNMVLSAM